MYGFVDARRVIRSLARSRAKSGVMNDANPDSAVPASYRLSLRMSYSVAITFKGQNTHECTARR